MRLPRGLLLPAPDFLFLLLGELEFLLLAELLFFSLLSGFSLEAFALLRLGLALFGGLPAPGFLFRGGLPLLLFALGVNLLLLGALLLG